MNLHVSNFLKHLELELNFSLNTTGAYSRDLRDWEEWMTDGGRRELHIDDVDTADLRAWLGHESRRGVAPVSVKRKASALRSLFRYLQLTGIIDRNPASRLTTPRQPKPLPVFIRAGEMQSLLSTDDPGATTPFLSARNSLIVDVLYSAGLRCQELLDLRDDMIDTDAGTMRVMGKRRKERIIPIGPDLCRRIDDFRRMRGECHIAAGPAQPLFVRPDGEPMDRKSVYMIVHRMMEAAGVHASRLSPHVLRHSCATDLLNDGADLNSVRELLGHRSLATTQVYTHLTYRDLQTNYQQAHPRATK